MPARSQAMDIPAGVLIEIAKDPKGYERMCGDLGNRKSAAEAAEAKARAAEIVLAEKEANFEALSKQWDKLAKKREDDNEAERERLALLGAKTESRVAELDAVRANLDEREAAAKGNTRVLDAREKELDGSWAIHNNEASKLVAQDLTLGVRERNVTEREAKLAENIKRITKGV